MAGFSENMSRSLASLKSFLFESMYRHYRVNRMTSKARRVVTDIFGYYLERPASLPTEWRRQAQGVCESDLGGVVRGFLVGVAGD